MQTISITVEKDVKHAFEQASEDERRAFGVFISLLLRESWARKSLVEVMKEIGDRPHQQKLTPELLQEIFEKIKHQQKPRLLAQLRQIKISTAPDLSINHDRHLS